MSDQLVISTAAAYGGTVIVALDGELDLLTVQRAQEVLCDQVEAGARRLVADLSGLRFIGTLGTRLLLDVQALLMAQGGSIALARPQPQVARLLQLTGADQRIPVYDSIGAAVRGQVPLPGHAP